MTRPARQKESWSLRLYARLLEFYPPAFLQRHREEMLQNFADFEEVAASRAALWLLMGKDLAMSLIPHFFASRLGNYVIAVFVAWILLFVVGYFFYGPTPGRPALHVFPGFLLGMLAMYLVMRLYGTPQSSSYVIGVLVASILLFTIACFRSGSMPGYPMVQVFGGLLLGMLSMSVAIRVYGMP
jgi:peptidoglycan/LPS O-acetylase OafA/YrhL